MKIAIGIPTDNNMKSEFVSSYVKMLFEAFRHFGGDVTFEQFFQQGVRTDKNRNLIVDRFLKNGFDGLLFLDSDMVYPSDMLIKYIESGKELIGGIYYKRTAPHYPVVYKFSNNLETPFDVIDPLYYGRNQIVAVDGLGTGGMFIKRSVFEKIKSAGRDPWFKYGDNYHLPYKTADQTTHDLVFCRKARECGVEIFLHTGVRMGHISEHVVTDEDWKTDREIEAKEENKRVEIIVPTYGKDSFEVMNKCLESLIRETEGDYIIHVVIDGDPDLLELVKNKEYTNPRLKITYNDENIGWPNTINKVINESENNYFVYTGCDVIVGKGWLEEAMRVFADAFPEKDGVVTFNDGKWKGEVACHGLVHKNTLKHTGKTLFFPYHHYNSDLELTTVMKSLGKYAYAYDSVMYHEQAKIGRSTAKDGLSKVQEKVEEDHQTYQSRKAIGFPLH